MFTSTPATKATVPTAATPYDPKVGPVIRPEHWTPEMLAAPLTHSLLCNQVDPAAFVAARRARLETPSPATIITEYSGVVHSEAGFHQPAQSLATPEDATAMYVRLLSLGMSPTFDVVEQPAGGSADRYEWRGETRRKYAIGALAVAGLVRRYATTMDTLADQQTVEELRAAGMLR